MGTEMYAYFVVFIVVALVMNIFYRGLSRKRDNGYFITVIVGIVLSILGIVGVVCYYFYVDKDDAILLMQIVLGFIGGFVFYVVNILIERLIVPRQNPRQNRRM